MTTPTEDLLAALKETVNIAETRRQHFHHELKTAMHSGDVMEIEYCANRLTYWVTTAANATKDLATEMQKERSA